LQVGLANVEAGGGQVIERERDALAVGCIISTSLAGRPGSASRARWS